MDVKQQDSHPGKGLFYIEKGGQVVARMTYVWAGTDKIIIDHTEVDPVLKGQGAGKLMVSKAVDFARAKGLKILPICPFAKATFDKEAAFEDVL